MVKYYSEKMDIGFIRFSNKLRDNGNFNLASKIEKLPRIMNINLRLENGETFICRFHNYTVNGEMLCVDDDGTVLIFKPSKITELSFLSIMDNQ